MQAVIAQTTSTDYADAATIQPDNWAFIQVAVQDASVVMQTFMLGPDGRYQDGSWQSEITIGTSTFPLVNAGGVRFKTNPDTGTAGKVTAYAWKEGEPQVGVGFNLTDISSGTSPKQAVTIANGDDVAEGSTTSAAVITDTSGTVSGKLRGLVKWAFERMPAALGSAASAASLPVVIASDQGVFTVISPHQTGVIYSGATAVTPASTFANVAASQTDSNVVTATAAKVIRVLAVAVQCGGTATTIVFNTRTGAGVGTAISATFQNAANGGVVLPFNPEGWFDTVAGDILSVTTGAGSTTGIQISYAKV